MIRKAFPSKHTALDYCTGIPTLLSFLLDNPVYSSLLIYLESHLASPIFCLFPCPVDDQNFLTRVEEASWFSVSKMTNMGQLLKRDLFTQTWKKAAETH